jgi:hypothetical protein
MTTTAHPLVEEYLRRLDRSAQVLPSGDRVDLVAEIRSHLDSALDRNASESEIRNLLDRLGEPEDIVAAADPSPARPRRGAREVFALILLLTGFPPILGWLVGVGLLVWSPLWSTRQKLLGILIWPGGYTLTLGALGVASTTTQVCASGPVRVGSPANVTTTSLSCTSPGTSPWAIVLIVVLVVAPLVVTGYLYRAAGRATPAAG